jgi:hypothetical protein
MLTRLPERAPSLPQPAADALAASEALSHHIVARIAAAGGWIGFDRFMALALYTPGLGYYAGGAHKFGASGDFVTAPELSASFAQTLAGQVLQVLALSAPQIIEVGAGSGQLADRPAARTRTARPPARALRDPRTVGRIAGASAADHQPPESSPAATRALA